MTEEPTTEEAPFPPRRRDSSSSQASSAEPDPVSTVDPPGSRVGNLETMAMELYCQSLLGHSHDLLFQSITSDDEPRDDLLDKARTDLEDAEAMCMTGHLAGRVEMVATCWYLRGFLADIHGDGDTTARCFSEAVRYDPMYITFHRVKLHLYMQSGDRPPTDPVWDNTASLTERWSTIRREGSRRLTDDVSAATSPQYSNREKEGRGGRPRESELFSLLIRDVSRPPKKDRPLNAPLASPPLSNRTSTTTTRSSQSSTRQVLDRFIESLRNGPGPKRAAREAPERRQQRDQPPPSDLVKAWLLGKRAESDAPEARPQPRVEAHRDAALAALTRRPSMEEALLSDTPAIAELDTAHHGVSGQRVTGPSLDTRGARRWSLSSKTSPVSPTVPSPLREAALPDDVVGDD